MALLGAVEAKRHFSELLDRVTRGENITIARHGVPVAILVPVEEVKAKLTHKEIVERMRKLRKRIKPPEVRRFVALLNDLTVVLDSPSVADTMSNVLPLAREYGLSAHDASYLDVAMRHGVPLATLDSNLQNAGRKAGVEIFSEA